MKTVIVRFPNHPVNNRATFAFETVSQATAMIESEVEMLQDDGLTSIQIELSFKDMEESEFKSLPDFHGW